MRQRIIYPFTAIVGQDQMRRALILNAVNPRIGGVLIRGERGTAKSTAARALAALLPEIEVVADCPFGCHPTRHDMMCDNCRDRLDSGERLPAARRKTRMIDLPISATEDRVVGTLDIESAIQKGERRFDPGVLASANRGLLYVDEVNLLDDHVVDLLLDSAAMGINVVEREGISFQHPARFILIGTMNPEEGDLRPQLLDRFALSVSVHGLINPAQRMAILERHVAFEENPDRFCAEWEPREKQITEQIRQAREIVEDVTYDRRDLAVIAQLTADLHVDGHRADLVILKTARAHAAFEGRRAITQRDILVAAELALPHRIRQGPFQEVQVSMHEMEERIQEIQETQDVESAGQAAEPDEMAAESKKKPSLN
ncbi:MAG: ATP-binding protein [Anaerolineae bacterium]|nr:ATP-binding protein [Anaerolineae bacterium]